MIVQPLLLVVMPLARYDARFPLYESTFMLATSIGAWRDVLVACYGLGVGVMLWQRRPDANRVLGRWLTVALISSLLLLSLSMLLPFHSYLRKPLRLDQAQRFIETLGVMAALYACQWLARRPVKAGREAAHGDEGLLLVADCSCKPWLSGLGRASFTLAGLGLCATVCFTRPNDLFEAAWEGDSDQSRQLLSSGLDVNSLDRERRMPIHFASTRDVAALLLSTASRIEQSYFVTPDDLRDLPGLIARLRRSADPVSRHLWRRFSPALRQLLSQPMPSEQQAKAALTEELNRILHERLEFDPSLFAGVALTESTRQRMARQPEGLERVHLGRLLLDDALTGQLARYHVEWSDVLKDTPLHLAALHGRTEVALLLIEKGAYVNASNHWGVTPLDCALAAKAAKRPGPYRAMIALLKENGAWANVQPITTE